MDDETDKKIFAQLLEYYREMVEETSEDDIDELSDDEYESRKLEFYGRYPLLKDFNIYNNWKGLYIAMSSDGQYTRWMLPTVFGARNEELTKARHEFEMFYFGKLICSAEKFSDTIVDVILS